MKQPAGGALARARRGIGAAALRALLSSLLMLQGAMAPGTEAEHSSL